MGDIDSSFDTITITVSMLGKTSKKNCIKSENSTIGGEGDQKNY